MVQYRRRLGSAHLVEAKESPCDDHHHKVDRTRNNFDAQASSQAVVGTRLVNSAASPRAVKFALF